MEAFLPLQGRLEAFAFAMARDENEGCDLVGETVLRAFEHFDEIVDRKAFLGYLFSIASNLWRRRLQRDSRFGVYDAEQAEQIHYGGTPPDISADVELLYRALAQLPELQREAVTLFELSDLSIRDIRQIQGGTLSAVKLRLHRGRKQLARLMGAATEDRASHSSRRGNL